MNANVADNFRRNTEKKHCICRNTGCIWHKLCSGPEEQVVGSLYVCSLEKRNAWAGDANVYMCLMRTPGDRSVFWPLSSCGTIQQRLLTNAGYLITVYTMFNSLHYLLLIRQQEPKQSWRASLMQNRADPLELIPNELMSSCRPQTDHKDFSRYYRPLALTHLTQTCPGPFLYSVNIYFYLLRKRQTHLLKCWRNSFTTFSSFTGGYFPSNGPVLLILHYVPRFNRTLKLQKWQNLCRSPGKPSLWFSARSYFHYF